MKINPPLSSFLDFARWTSAMLVVLGHLRSVVFINYDAVARPSLLIRFFYLITGLGHEAVMVFFVLSGFLVGGKVFHGIRNGSFRGDVYFIQRISRLYAVLIFALLLGFILDWTGSHYFNSSGIYSNSHGYISAVNYSIEDRITLKIFLGNLLMLQTIITPTFGSNGPLWSVANEFWYYILFPLSILLFSSGTRFYRKLIILGFLFFSVLLLLQNGSGNEILLYFSTWLLGTVVALIRHPIIKFPLIPATFLFVTLLISRIDLLILGTSLWAGFANDFLIALTFGLLLNTMAYSQTKHGFSPALNKRMADFSYSLYAIHFPVMVFLVAAIYTISDVGLGMQPSSAIAWVIFGIIFISLYIIGDGFSKITENKTPQIRRSLFQHYAWAKQRMGGQVDSR